MLILASVLREMFGVQLYKNNAYALLLHILSILNIDWLQHARSVRGVYEYDIIISFVTSKVNWEKVYYQVPDTGTSQYW